MGKLTQALLLQRWAINRGSERHFLTNKAIYMNQNALCLEFMSEWESVYIDLVGEREKATNLGICSELHL